MAVVVEVRLIWLTRGLDEQRRLLHERDAERVRAGLHGNTDLQVGVHGRVLRLALRRLHGEHLHLRLVEQQLEVVRFGQALDVLVTVSHEPNLDLVLAVHREGVVEHGSAPRPDRQPRQVVFLREVRGKPDGVPAGRKARPADRDAADLLRCGQVAVEQRGRQVADGHVVEAVARLVGREERVDVHIEREEVANGVPGTRFGSDAGWWPCGPDWDGRRPPDRAASPGSGRSRRKWLRPDAPSVQPAASGGRGACGRFSPTPPRHERRQERPARATTRPSSPRRHGSSHSTLRRE